MEDSEFPVRERILVIPLRWVRASLPQMGEKIAYGRETQRLFRREMWASGGCEFSLEGAGG
ncbi:MAG: hypothetical protein M0Q92_11995, partial [Methanoregula sp.]|nr:hypothetical protein [Methanoregula sp.]